MVIVSLEYEKRTEGGKSGDGSDLFAYDLRAPIPLMVIFASPSMSKMVVWFETSACWTTAAVRVLTAACVVHSHLEFDHVRHLSTMGGGTYEGISTHSVCSRLPSPLLRLTPAL